MDAIEAILTRRSIRQYTGQAVPEETVNQLLRAAMHAPSARNTRSWHFVVITDRRKLDAVPTFHPYAAMVKLAPLGIMVCGDERLEERTSYWLQNCSAAAQNILLAAHALGLGGVWLGVYPNKERVEGMRRLAGVPDHVVPMAFIVIGYPAETPPSPERYDSTRVHYNSWE
jgi:nitroreductase